MFFLHLASSIGMARPIIVMMPHKKDANKNQKIKKICRKKIQHYAENKDVQVILYMTLYMTFTKSIAAWRMLDFHLWCRLVLQKNHYTEL